MAGSEKSEGAFRTIREVADWLVVPTHVLRFWESKFEQIAPVKGAGGRRYYRPDDMRLLGGIKVMLHDQGLTVRGVSQKIDDEGVESVMDLSPDLDAVDAPPPQRTRRVIRAGDDAPSEKVVAFNRKPGPDPAPPPSQPDTLDHEVEPPQPVDVEAPPQPVDDAPTPPETPPQPKPDSGVDAAAPGSDPAPPPRNERGPEPSAPPSPDLPEAVEDKAASFADVSGETPEIQTAQPELTRLETRQLRRIIRKLRGLIEEVEAEMSQGGPT